MEKKLIDLHKEWIIKKEMHSEGLCSCLPDEYKETFNFFTPSKEDNIKLYNKGLTTGPCGLSGYWASDVKLGCGDRRFQYGKTRQSIVLLICAIHGEI
jgi:hypothetical protein